MNKLLELINNSFLYLLLNSLFIRFMQNYQKGNNKWWCGFNFTLRITIDIQRLQILFLLSFFFRTHRQVRRDIGCCGTLTTSIPFMHASENSDWKSCILAFEVSQKCKLRCRHKGACNVIRDLTLPAGCFERFIEKTADNQWCRKPPNQMHLCLK